MHGFLGGDSETSPGATSSKVGDNSIKPELNHVQSTNQWPQSQNCTASESSSKDSDDTVSSLAESIHIKTASSSDSESSDTEERGNYHGLHSKHSHSAYVGVEGSPDPHGGEWVSQSF